MFEHNKQKKLISFLAVAALGGAAQGVHAHAGFKEQIDSGTSTQSAKWNAVTITHGCNSNAGGEGSTAPHKDVIALSVVFPDFTKTSNVVMRKSLSTATVTAGEEPTVTSFENDIVDSTADVALKTSIALDMGGDQLFANNLPTVDASGNNRGWQGWNGNFPIKGPVLVESAKKPDGSDISTTGLSPFRIGGIQFKETSCAKTLRIRVAVADWCGKGNKANKDPASNVDVWIGSQTALFNDPATMPNPSATPIFWPTLTINNKDYDATACASADYDTLFIEPSTADIDALLPMRKQKYPKGSGEKYWPTK